MPKLVFRTSDRNMIMNNCEILGVKLEENGERRRMLRTKLEKGQGQGHRDVLEENDFLNLRRSL